MLCLGHIGMKWQNQGIKHFPQMLPLSFLVWWWGAPWKYAFLHFCYFKNQLLAYRVLSERENGQCQVLPYYGKGIFSALTQKVTLGMTGTS